jgi:hypothetical protein
MRLAQLPSGTTEQAIGWPILATCCDPLAIALPACGFSTVLIASETAAMPQQTPCRAGGAPLLSSAQEPNCPPFYKNEIQIAFDRDYDWGTVMKTHPN